MIKRKRNIARVMVLILILTTVINVPMGFATSYPAPTNEQEAMDIVNAEYESLTEEFRIDSVNYPKDGLGLLMDIMQSDLLSPVAELNLSSQGGTLDATNQDIVVLTPSYNTNLSEQDAVTAEILSMDLTSYDDIYSYITGLENDPSNPYNAGQTSYSLMFEGGGVCAGYANLTSEMLNHANIDNTIELGVYLNYSRTVAIPHAWNTIDTGSGYFNADLMNNKKNGGFTVYTKSEMMNGEIPDDSSLAYVVDVTSADFKLAYDDVNPNLSVTIDEENSTDEVVKVLITYDDVSSNTGRDSGIKEIIASNGSQHKIEYGDTGEVTFDITTNGTHEIIAIDKAGNETKEIVEITRFGETIPEPTTYTVTFIDHDGSTLDTQTVEENLSATAPTEPTRTGYTFSGWDVDFSNVTSDLTVTATYTEDVEVTYTVTFLDDLGNELKTESVIEGENASSPIPPTHMDRIFNGWDKSFDNVTSDLTVTALYANKHAVEFFNHNNEVVATQYVADGEDCPTPEYIPTRLGYSFDGWDGNFTNITSDTEIHATYTENTTGHTVTFTANDIEINSQTVNDGEDAIEPMNVPDVSGKRFAGWDKPLTNITTDTAITAIYENRVYHTLSFNTNGGNPVDSQTIEDIENVAILPTPTKEGFEFVEWQLNGNSYATGNKLTKDITLDAVWNELAKDEFIVTLNGDSAEFENETFTVVDGDTFNTNVVPTKCNSEFIEWQLNGESVTFPLTITESITLTAVYEYLPKEVFIYPNNGEVYDPLDNIELLYETQLPDLEKDGFEFSHWELDGVEVTEFPVAITEACDIHAVWTEIDDTPVVEEPIDNSEDDTSNEDDTTTEEPTEEVDDTPTPPPTNNESSSGGSGGSSGGSFVPPPILAMEDSEKTPEEEKKKEQETLLLKAEKSTSVRNIFESIDAYEIKDDADEDEFVKTFVESLSKNETLSKNEEDKVVATEIVKNIVNAKKTQSKKDKLLAELNYYKIKDENLKKDLTKTVQNNMLKLEKTEDFVEAMDELSQIDEEVDKVTDTEVADVLKLKIKVKMDKSPLESLGEQEEKKTTKAIESIINTNKDFDFFNNLRAETYIEQLEDKDLKSELKAIHNSVKNKHKDKPIVPIKREATPPIIIDGRETSFKIKNNDGTTEDVKPFIKDGRTLSSVRVIAETLNTDVSWDGKTKSILLTKDDANVKMQINSNIMYVNGEAVRMDTMPIIKDSRSYFPSRFIAESLGSTVLWNEEYNTVFID